MVKILVTGANGQMGSEFRKVSSSYSHFEFIFTDVQELDICDYQSLENFVKQTKPEYIVNCAAYTAVDKAETEKDLAQKINSDAVSNLSMLSTIYSIKLIHISTDYVFNSSGKNTPYNESDPTGPESVYGHTKLKGEVEAQKSENHIIIRTSWLYSSFGNNFMKTVLRLGKERNEINMIYDQIGTPCYAGDLVSAIVSIIEHSESTKSFKSGIYHYSNEGVCSWYDFAYEIIKVAGLKCKINPIETKDYPLPAKRPTFSVMNKSKIKQSFGITIPHWTDSLRKCYKELIDKQN